MNFDKETKSKNFFMGVEGGWWLRLEGNMSSLEIYQPAVTKNEPKHTGLIDGFSIKVLFNITAMAWQ